MASITAIIVDDEPLAREGLRQLLALDPDIRICAECTDGYDAVAKNGQFKPDIMFLDVQMPEMSGFDVVRAMQDAHLPLIIFVTAYDDYALRAFDVHALDYLLKPVEKDRLFEAVTRAKDQVLSGARSSQNARLRELVNDKAGPRLD
jgi:two-component system, LytTR family, response regulator